jgi:hypothetical protein
MKIRFSLTHAVLGSISIDEPDGWKAITIILERNPDFNSLWEKFEGSFKFYGDTGRLNGGLDFIRQVIDEYGPDAALEMDSEIAPDDINFQELFSGLLSLDAIQEHDDNTATIPIIPNNRRTMFKNRYETPVDLMSETALDGSAADVFAPANIELTSQVVPMSFEGISTSMGSEPGISPYDYLQMSWDEIELEEFEEYFLLPQISNSEIPSENFAVEFAGEYRFIIQTNMWDSNGASPIKDDYEPVLSINGVELVTFTERIQPYTDDDATYINSDYVEYELDYTTTLNAGDLIRVYLRRKILTGGGGTPSFQGLRWNGNFEDQGVVFPTRYSFTASAQIIAQTIYPNTQSDGVLLHDAGGYVMDRILGEPQRFYSEILGSSLTNYRQYEADGCRWRNMLLKGLQIRQYSIEEKPFFLSFKQWWEGIHPMLCLGLGYENIDGEEVFRVEEREHFFDPVPAVNLDNVSDITRMYDVSQMYKTVKTGHKVWQSENISGIDDAQTKHTYAAAALQRTGTELVIESDFIAASLAIETTRRQTRKKSADYKFDDNTFIIALGTSEGSQDNTFLPELDENFSSIQNLQNPESRYNSIHTPARYLMRWARAIFGGLQHYVGSLLKFTAGEGNYDMISNYDGSTGCDEFTGELSEKQNIEVEDNFDHRPEMYQIITDLTIDQYLEIRDNKKKAIGISQTDSGHVAMFIKELKYELWNSKVTILAWPVEYLSIQVPTSSYPVQICVPIACENAYLTESEEEFITQDGDCLVLQ